MWITTWTVTCGNFRSSVSIARFTFPSSAEDSNRPPSEIPVDNRGKAPSRAEARGKVTRHAGHSGAPAASGDRQNGHNIGGTLTDARRMESAHRRRDHWIATTMRSF
ncbi:hypothetical protein llg_02200 [Luteolibacter sp. LG18]|nr:hypothetical protein llg_02200 [Luteolibacter sp. LG18]